MGRDECDRTDDELDADLWDNVILLTLYFLFLFEILAHDRARSVNLLAAFGA